VTRSGRRLGWRWWRAVLTRDHFRLVAAGVISTLSGVVMAWQAPDDVVLSVNVTWLGFSASYLALTVAAFYRATPATVRAWVAHHRRPNRQWTVRWLVGEARGVGFTSTVALFAVGAAVLLIRSGDESPAHTALGAVGIVLSWVLLQTSMTLYLAAAYHGSGGLTFTDEPEPDLLDFAYLAFTVGTSFTIVDAKITDRRVRRAVLGHSLLSFAFNTVLLGLVVTFLAG
jgi:uncharacterized membrane protein